MARSRGSIAVLMNSLSSGSSSSSSVCGLRTLTSAINSSLARSREMRASSSALMSASFIAVPSRHLGPAVAQALLHARPDDENNADREDRGRQRPQEEHRVIVIGDHQGLVERAFRELAQDEPDHQADQRVAVAAQEIAQEPEEDRDEHV